MSRFTIHLSGKGLQQRTVDNVLKKLGDLKDASVSVTKEPDSVSRSDRLDQAIESINDGKGAIEELKSELEEWLSNLPENLQSGEKADQLQSAIDALDELYNEVPDLDSGNVEFPGMY